MIIGIPRETKPGEARVAMTPEGARELLRNGHEVLVQTGAGDGCALPDPLYTAAGARIVPDAAAVFAGADLICKVKEPRGGELDMFRSGQILFTFLHLAAYPDVAEQLRLSGVVAIGYETVEGDDGRLVLLAPMSEVAGRMSVQIGAHFLERAQGGRGILLGGVTGVRPAKVLVLGAGAAGMHAAAVAGCMGAEVIVLDIDINKLRNVEETLGGRAVGLFSTDAVIREEALSADLLIGSVLLRGRRAPRLVDKETVSEMRKGAVIVDIAVDQGGCIETSRETRHDDPVFVAYGVLHYGVANMPAAVPYTSTYALANATLPYTAALASKGLTAALAADPGFARGVQVAAEKICNPDVAMALGTAYVPLSELSIGDS